MNRSDARHRYANINMIEILRYEAFLTINFALEHIKDEKIKEQIRDNKDTLDSYFDKHIKKVDILFDELVMHLPEG